MRNNILYKEYQDHLRKVSHLKSTTQVLDIDALLSLGDKGHDIRAEQMGILGELIHNLLTNEEYTNMLTVLKKSELDSIQRKNIEISVKDLIKKQKLPVVFVKQCRMEQSIAEEQYRRAKKEKDFSIFAPHLEKLVAMKQQEAEYLWITTTPYDVFLDQFDPGLTEVYLESIFSRIKTELIPIIRRLYDLKQNIPDLSIASLETAKNRKLFHSILGEMGYDIERGDIIEAPASFMIDGNPTDTRIFYRDSGKSILEMIGTIIHEWWHGLYEQSFREEYLGLPMSDSASYMIHESQSRLYENHIGFSKEYLSHILPKLQELYKEDTKDITPEELYCRANRVEPIVRRVEADEVSYHAHILIRYELERDLINGKISVNELPSLWNAKYKEYLGIDVRDDVEGVLQDIHWSSGSFGYFPTYSLGTFYSAQFFAQIEKEIPNLSEKISRGELLEIKTWLNEKVHVHGRLLTSAEILQSATGSDIDMNHFFSYIRNKYSKLYWVQL